MQKKHSFFEDRSLGCVRNNSCEFWRLRMKNMCKILILVLFVITIVLLRREEMRASALHQDQGRDGPPPLPHGCGGFGTPSNYETPVCCVSGYVYVNGVPSSNVDVSVSANGQIKSSATSQHVGVENPYFSIQLDTEPLKIKPGDTVTITASVGGHSYSNRFIAQSGGQQVDVVIPTLAPDSKWSPILISGRRNHAMTYDQASDVSVLFGGLSHRNEVLDETWLFDGNSWRQKRTEQSPPARHNHVMIYDSQLGVVLFGGQGASGDFLQDLWQWTGGTWQLVSASGPAPRAGHALSYDRVRQRLVLFGGQNEQGQLNDLWEWDGSTWQEIDAQLKPRPREGHALMYDPVSERTLLFGGDTAVENFEPNNDLWAWDGSKWIQIETENAPPASAGHSLVYDEDQTRAWLFGGQIGDAQSNNELWSLANGQWRQHEADSAITEIRLSRQDHAAAYDQKRKELIVFGGFQNSLESRVLADTWSANMTEGKVQWEERQPVPPFLLWTDSASAQMQENQLLIFGGRSTTARNETFIWTADSSTLAWQKQMPEHSPNARYGHGLSNNHQGTEALLFGGIGASGLYLNDAWIWNGTGWIERLADIAPAARAYFSITYDHHRHLWLLFGGENDDGFLADFWEFDGTSWKKIDGPTPSSRRLATLTYDPIRRRAILFGGQNESGYLNDLWEWNGEVWQQADAPVSPLPRAGHGAMFDAENQVMVMAGGSAEGALRDTWAWDGRRWFPRVTEPRILPYQRLNLHPTHSKHILALGMLEGGNGQGEGFSSFEYIEERLDTIPQATIGYVNPRDVRQGIDEITLFGQGADADSTDHIVAYRWSHNGLTLGTGMTATITTGVLPLGAQTIALEVQDDEGNWSPPVSQAIWVRAAQSGGTNSSNPTWTLLVHVAADNEIGLQFGEIVEQNPILRHLLSARQRPGAQIAFLYDGPAEDDTWRYVVDANGAWSETQLAEADMGDPTTLQAFVQWGINNLPSDYLSLSFIGHANGIVGIGVDQHGAENEISTMEPSELRTALQVITDDGSRKIDVLHFDVSSFGLLENAAIVADQATFVIASPDTNRGIYDYDLYREFAYNAASPRAYAEKVAQHYAARNRNRPFSIALFDMVYFAELVDSVGMLGSALATFVDSSSPNRQLMAQLRSQMRFYDSGGDEVNQPDLNDSYVDLLSMASTILASDALTTDAKAGAQMVVDSLPKFVIYADQNRASTETAQASSKSAESKPLIGLYYPPFRDNNIMSVDARYRTHKLFSISPDWGWTAFIETHNEQLGPNGTPQVLNQPLLSMAVPDGEDDSRLFLPLVQR